MAAAAAHLRRLEQVAAPGHLRSVAGLARDQRQTAQPVCECAPSLAREHHATHALLITSVSSRSKSARSPDQWKGAVCSTPPPAGAACGAYPGGDREYLRRVDVESLFASLCVSSVGYVAFAYGKRQRRIPQLVTGLTLMIFPYFVDGVLLMLLFAAALLLVMWVALKLGW
jgi:hypothetical protein